jgi:HEAT repeat protein
MPLPEPQRTREEILEGVRRRVPNYRAKSWPGDGLDHGKRVSPEELPTIVKAMRSDVLDERRMAVRALGDVGSPASSLIPELFTLLNDDDYETAVRAARSLVAIAVDVGPRVASALQKGELRYAELGFGIIGAFGGESKDEIPRLLEFLSDVNLNVRRGAVTCLGEIGPAAAPCASAVIDRLINDPEDVVACAAAEALGRMGPGAVGAANALRDVLMRPARNGDDGLKLSAVSALQHLGRDGHKALLEALNDESSAVRVVAATSLRKIGSAATFAIPALVHAMTDGNNAVRAHVGRALLATGGECVGALSELLKVAQSPICEDICSALGTIGAPARKAIPDLLSLLENSDARIRVKAAEAICRIDSRNETASERLAREMTTMRAREERDTIVGLLESHGSIDATIRVWRGQASNEEEPLHLRLRALEGLSQVAANEAKSVLARSAEMQSELEGMRLRPQLRQFVEILRLYDEGATSFAEVAQRLKGALNGGDALGTGIVSKAGVTRCIDKLTPFFANVFGQPEFQLFEKTSGVRAQPTHGCRAALEWTKKFLARHGQEEGRASD